MQGGLLNVTAPMMKLIAALALVGLLLMLTGCLTTRSIGTDAGCQIWREYRLKPSRLDTPATQAGLIQMNRGMAAACEGR